MGTPVLLRKTCELFAGDIYTLARTRL